MVMFAGGRESCETVPKPQGRIKTDRPHRRLHRKKVTDIKSRIEENTQKALDAGKDEGDNAESEGGEAEGSDTQGSAGNALSLGAVLLEIEWIGGGEMWGRWTQKGI